MNGNYIIKKVKIINIISLIKVINILYLCGKDMAQKNGLQHWNNSRIKNAVIVFLCALKNEIYLVLNDEKAIATFQIKKEGEALRFQKLATDPRFAGKGVGSFCMTTIEDIAVSRGCKRVALEVYDKSAHAISFYEHRNYTVCGSVKTLKYTELKMEKYL